MSASVPTVSMTPLGRQIVLVSPWRGKRVMDFLTAVLLLVLLSPIMLVVAIAVKVTSHGGVFYRDRRLGRGGVPYRMWKFRTMKAGAAPLLTAEGKLVVRKNDSRLTPVGRILRTLHLDEIAQLLNVLAGEMSFVGPRSGRPEYEKDYSENAYERLRVLPGITGLAAIVGARHMDNEEVYRVEAIYVRNQSFRLDLAIMLLTPVYVLMGEKIPRRCLGKVLGNTIKETHGFDRSEF